MLKTIKDDKLKSILEERGIVFKKIQELNEQIVVLDKERTKEGYKMNKLKEKTKVIMDKQKFNLDEFEFISSIFLEKGECKVEILDRVEEFKKMVRDEANENTTNEHKS